MANPQPDRNLPARAKGARENSQVLQTGPCLNFHGASWGLPLPLPSLLGSGFAPSRLSTAWKQEGHYPGESDYHQEMPLMLRYRPLPK